MASADDENILMENSGRRTRSGRKVSSTTPVSTPARTTRRISKRQTQLTDHDEDAEIQLQPQIYDEADPQSAQLIGTTMLAEEMQGTLTVVDVGGDGNGDEIIEEIVNDLHYESHQHLDDDVEMSVHTETGVDEKSSSFPFGTVEQSETSEDAHNEEEYITTESNAEGGVENSLLASLAGDNANSLPSVGGNDEMDNKKANFDTKELVNATHMQTNCEKMDSTDDSMSEPAIAEELPDDIDASNATIVNTEIISEDELPPPTKPEINDAEEVSDDELPAPQRAELPPDAEVISEDELPTNNNIANEVKSTSSPLRNIIPIDADVRRKRKADIEEVHQENDTNSTSEGSKSEEPKKKSTSNEQYNPMSPTSESNDSPPVEKKSKVDCDTDHKEKKKEKEREKDKEKEHEKEKERKKLPELDKYWRAVKDDPADFTAWTYLLQYVDNESDAEAAREAYDTFLSHYPYCYGYWRKYADYEKRKGLKDNCNAVFERGLEAIPLSVDLWIHYLTHVKTNHAEDEAHVRSQFERAIEACGLEFRSDKLWDAYIKWENESKRYHRIVQIYDRLLAIPTQGYSGHFDNFQDLINQQPLTSTISNEELNKVRSDLNARSRNRSSVSSSSKSSSKSRREGSKEKERERDEKMKDADDNHGNKSEDDTICTTTTDLTDSSERDVDNNVTRPTQLDFSDPDTLTEEEIPLVKDKVISMRRKIHKQTVAAVTARWSFEEGIKRPYFHVKPLERCQLKNWKDYLDFEIEKGDRKRVIVLFERCLIACALYDEFWLKMIRYLETQVEQSDVPAIISDVFRRACQIHHPDKPSLHLLWAAFEECQSNFDGAAQVLISVEKKCPNLLQVAYRRINVERRRGDFAKCRELYEYYINNAKNKSIAGSLAIKYARFLNKICKDLDAGLNVLRAALEKDPANTRVALQMIDLVLQRAVVDEDEVVSIMDKFMARENIEPEQKVLFAQRKVEFLEDFGSAAKGLQDAQRSLQLALNKANEAKKKRESSPSRKLAGMKETNTSVASSTAQNVYNNGTAVAGANYNYNSANTSAAYYGGGQQTNAGGGGTSYQQQQTYDSYYNQWQYSNNAANNAAGYNYGQWSGYGNYY